MQRRTVVYELYLGTPTPPGDGLRANWTVSRRDGQDPIELLRARPGLGPSPR